MTNDPLYDLLYVCHPLCGDPKCPDDYSDSMVSSWPHLLPPGTKYVRSNGGKHMPAYEGWRLEGFKITYKIIKKLFAGHWLMLIVSAGLPIPEEITMPALADAASKTRKRRERSEATSDN